MNKKIAIWSIIGIVVLVGVLVFFLSGNDSVSDGLSRDSILSKISPVSIITLNDENSSVVITKNNIDKTAKVRMEAYLNSSEMNDNEFGLDMSGFVVNLGTTMTCGLMSLAIFNETAFNELTEEWNNMNFTSDDEETEKDTDEDKNIKNYLVGYNITQFDYYLKDKDTRKILSECVITGPGADNIVMKIDGEVVYFNASEDYEEEPEFDWDY